MECLNSIGSILSGLGTIGLCYIAYTWKQQLVPEARKDAIKYIAHLNVNLKFLNEYLQQHPSTHLTLLSYLADPELQKLNEKIAENLALVKSAVLYVISLEREQGELTNSLNKFMEQGDGITQNVPVSTLKITALLKLNDQLLDQLMKIENF